MNIIYFFVILIIDYTILMCLCIIYYNVYFIEMPVLLIELCNILYLSHNRKYD